MAMTSPYAAIANFGFAAKFRDGPAKPSRREAGRTLSDRTPTGQWERLEAERKQNLALRKAELAYQRERASREPVTAADFRHSALANAAKV